MNSKGFTIIELIIAIFVLSIAIIGVFGAFSIIVILTSSAADRLTAAYLAQEGAEIVRNIRDNNWLNMADPDAGAAWDDNFDNCEAPGACEVDYTTMGSDVRPWTGDDDTGGDYLNTKDGFYVYDADNPSRTKFRRKISIVPITNSNGDIYILKVSVKVFWDEKPSILNPNGNDGSIETVDTLYNWY